MCIKVCILTTIPLYDYSVGMRVSPLRPPEPFEDRPHVSVPKRIARSLGHAANRLLTIEPTKRYEYAPVTNGTAAIARYVGEHMDAGRLSIVNVRGQALTEQTPTYKLSEIQERGRRDQMTDTTPIPRVVCTVYGQNYGNFRARRDRFMCSFSIYDLEGGGRVVQAEPYQWHRKAYEVVSETYHELFGAGPRDPRYAEHTSYTLGTYDEGISFTESRPFNHHAFGMDIVPILEYISCSVFDEDLNFQLMEGRIEQYS